MTQQNQAPVTRTNAIQDILSVSLIEFKRPCQLSLPVGTVTMSVNKTPAAPASVGVKIPTYNPPITSEKIDSASTTPESDLNLSLKLVFGPGGPNLGLMRQRTIMVSTKRIPKRIQRDLFST